MKTEDFSRFAQSALIHGATAFLHSLDEALVGHLGDWVTQRRDNGELAADVSGGFDPQRALQSVGETLQSRVSGTNNPLEGRVDRWAREQGGERGRSRSEGADGVVATLARGLFPGASDGVRASREALAVAATVLSLNLVWNQHALSGSGPSPDLEDLVSTTAADGPAADSVMDLLGKLSQVTFDDVDLIRVNVDSLEVRADAARFEKVLEALSSSPAEVESIYDSIDMLDGEVGMPNLPAIPGYESVHSSLASGTVVMIATSVSAITGADDAVDAITAGAAAIKAGGDAVRTELESGTGSVSTGTRDAVTKALGEVAGGSGDPGDTKDPTSEDPDKKDEKDHHGKGEPGRHVADHRVAHEVAHVIQQSHRTGEG